MQRVGLLLSLGFVFMFLPDDSSAETYQAEDPKAVREALKKARPGDEILLAAGVWKDAELRIEGRGSPELPIIVRAAEPGKTVLTGASRVRLSGEYVILAGIKLHNISGQKADWLEYRYDSKNRADHCIVRDCWLLEDESFEAVEKESRWIGIYGRGNRLENCRIEGKKNRGATVVVWLGEKDLGEHRIEDCYFGNRPRLGKNGGETIRIGDSDSSMQSAKCIVENNLFEHCNGETECISNKSCDNIYRGNTFREVQGTLTLRHGNRCLVEKNIFIGNRKSQTGGIRVIGEGHRVIGNHLQELEGDGFRTAIALIDAVPNAPLNGYLPVRNVLIEGNLIVNCKHSVMLSYNDERDATIVPTEIVFKNQRIVAPPKRHAIEFGDIDKPLTKLPDGFQFEGNLVQTDQTQLAGIAGMKLVGSIEIAKVKSLEPTDVGPAWMR